MRLVTWNVCDGFRSKFGHLERLRPDIAVLQEVRPECLKFADLSRNSQWLGEPGQKGLSVVAFHGWKLELASSTCDERWFLPLHATNGSKHLNVLAVWVDSMKDCVPPTLRAIEQLTDFLKSEPCVMAGDFNQSIHFDQGKSSGRRFATVVGRLAECSLRSVWHEIKGEEHGQETEPTFYWRWNKESRFHIDFAFASKSIAVTDIKVGGFDQYVGGKISDHVPVIVDFDIDENC